VQLKCDRTILNTNNTMIRMNEQGEARSEFVEVFVVVLVVGSGFSGVVGGRYVVGLGGLLMRSIR
jgi:hypothetical protein